MIGGIYIKSDKSGGLVQSISEMERMEGKLDNLSIVFSEMLKDEINANDEYKLYNGVKRIIRKYSADRNAITAINEFTSVISGGASLTEIIRIALDEAANPSLATYATVDESGYKH